MQLLSDYAQWYDSIFDDQPPLFHRHAFTRGGLGKRAQFELFRSLDLPTPPHGMVTELARRLETPLAGCAPPQVLGASTRLVVYTDELAHRGEGKVLLPVAEALEQFPSHFASVFVPSPAAATTLRLVRLGRLAFWIEQTARDTDWRSNRRDAEAVLAKKTVPAPNPVERVLWAVDFIRGPAGLLAVDFNTAPELSTLGETGALTPAEVGTELAYAAATAPGQLLQF